MKLVDIPRWDNAYHFQYLLGAPVPAPKGTKVEVTAVYDNSQMNAANPDPSAEVKAGLGGELLEGWLLYTSSASGTATAAATPADSVLGEVQVAAAAAGCAKCAEKCHNTVSTD
jgi:hypothetical protein